MRVSVVALGDVTPTLTVTSTTPLATKQAYAKQGMTFILSQSAQVVKLALAVAPKLIIRPEIAALVTANLNKDLTILAKLSSSIDDIVAGKKRFEPWLDVVKGTLSEVTTAWENASNGVLGGLGDTVQPAPLTTWEGVQKALRDVMALARDFGKTVGDIIKSIVGGAGEAAGSAIGNALIVPALVLGGLLLIARPILGTLAEKSPELIRAAKPLGGVGGKSPMAPRRGVARTAGWQYEEAMQAVANWSSGLKLQNAREKRYVQHYLKQIGVSHAPGRLKREKLGAKLVHAVRRDMAHYSGRDASDLMRLASELIVDFEDRGADLVDYNKR